MAWLLCSQQNPAKKVALVLDQLSEPHKIPSIFELIPTYPVGGSPILGLFSANLVGKTPTERTEIMILLLISPPPPVLFVDVDDVAL